MPLTVEQRGPAAFLIRDGDELVAELDSLRIVRARFRPGGRLLIGPTVPLSLYWMQYANHEDPERNAGASPSVTLLHREEGRISIGLMGSTASGACRSATTLDIVREPGTPSYRFEVQTRLEVVGPGGWTVTPNPFHGEVEFANVWPEGAFNPAGSPLYQASYVVGSDRVLRIPHHHLESSDKHMIPLRAGEKFLWALEDENLCLTVDSGREISGGVCAYMWDAHFAYKVCPQDTAVVLPAGGEFGARYTLAAVSRGDAERIIAGAVDRPSPEVSLVPVYIDGVNRITETNATMGEGGSSAWPWEQEGDEGSVFTRDMTLGYDDSVSLAISRDIAGTASWKVSALGPAYGKPAFPDSCRFRLSGFIRTRGVDGEADLALRLHREGKGSLFSLADYDVHEGTDPARGDNDWWRMDLVTPPISPAPDRVHILLRLRGRGKVWFDNILLEILK